MWLIWGAIILDDANGLRNVDNNLCNAEDFWWHLASIYIFQAWVFVSTCFAGIIGKATMGDEYLARQQSLEGQFVPAGPCDWVVKIINTGFTLAWAVIAALLWVSLGDTPSAIT